MSNTIKRVPLQSVVVHRDGQPFVPPIGQVFEFTADEVEQLERMNPDAVSAQVTMDAEAAPAPVPAAKKTAAKAAAKTEGDL